ncbi:MAG: phosphoribosylformylglycinamidine cyclo-ligase [Solirubrobacteraceae bacterium]
MSDAYAAAGVDTSEAGRGVAALVSVLSSIETARGSRSVLSAGHYASVLEVAPNLGIALSTDGVGSKLVLAEQLGRLTTVGIDCVAMNVNDIVCVGAEPLAMLDYLAVERVHEGALTAIASGLKRGAELAGVEIPGGELAVLPELIRGHPSPHGFDLCGACFGTVALDRIVTGERCAPGDALIGLPSSGLHSNGYTLARRAVQADDLDGPLAGYSGTLADALLEPTTIYVKAALELLREEIPVHGLAHITGDGIRNLSRLNTAVGFRIDAPLPVPAICAHVCERAGLTRPEAYDIFNMGCGFIVVVPARHAQRALTVLEAHHRGSAQIGSVTSSNAGAAELR